MKQASFSKPLFWSCLLVLFCILFDFASTNMAALYIIGDLGGSFNTASYTISFFGFGNAAGIPLATFLATRFGIKRMMLTCMILFTLANLFAIFSVNFEMLLLFRFLQGISSGPIFILITTLLSKIATDDQKNRFMRYVLILFIAAPALGATFGGSIAYEIHWKWIFLIDTTLLLFATIIIAHELKGYYSQKEKKAFDFVGYFLFVVGLLSLGFFATTGEIQDWFRSPLLAGLFVTGTLSILSYIVWAMIHPDPIIDLSLLKNFKLVFAYINLFVLFGTYFGMVILVSLWLHLYVNYSAHWIAATIGSMAASSFVLMFALQYTQNRKKIPLLALSIVILIVTSFYTSHFNQNINFERIVLSRIIVGFGIALFLPVIFNLIITHCLEEERIKAFTLFQLTRTVASSLGAVLYTTLWQRRFVFFHSRLGSNLTAYSRETNNFFLKSEKFGLSKEAAKEKLNDFLNKQAQSLALNDCFHFMGWLLIALLVFAVISKVIFEIQEKKKVVN